MKIEETTTHTLTLTDLELDVIKCMIQCYLSQTDDNRVRRHVVIMSEMLNMNLDSRIWETK